MLFLALALAASDPLFAQQKALPEIHAPEAWQITTGVDGQRVGVVDTGLVRIHEEMIGKDDGGWDFLENKSDYTDNQPVASANGPMFHGTHVAGIIAASGDDGKGTAGIDWKAHVVTARALGGDGGGTNITSMAGARWLAGIHVDGVPDIDKPVDVINMSLGFQEQCDPATQQAVDEIVSKGIAIVASSGNHGTDFGTSYDSVNTPANCNGVISVGAVDFDGNVTDYSNVKDGPVDVVAPGGTEQIGIESLGAGPSSYVPMQGTSMAAPHVTGVVELMLALDSSLSPSDIKDLLKSLPSCSGCQGHAMLDAKAALAAVQNGGTKVTESGGCSSTGGAPFALALVAFSVIRRKQLRVRFRA
jgi:serine protease